jgi:hypothetical protein
LPDNVLACVCSPADQEVTITYGREGYWQQKALQAADIETLQEGMQRGRQQAHEANKELKQQLKQQLDAAGAQQRREQQLLQALQQLQQAVAEAVGLLAADGSQQQVQDVCWQLVAAGEAARAVIACTLAGSGGSQRHARVVTHQPSAAVGAGVASVARSEVATAAVEDSQAWDEEEQQQQQQQEGLHVPPRGEEDMSRDLQQQEQHQHQQQQEMSTELVQPEQQQ